MSASTSKQTILQAANVHRRLEQAIIVKPCNPCPIGQISPSTGPCKCGSLEFVDHTLTNHDATIPMLQDDAEFETRCHCMYRLALPTADPTHL